MKDLQIRTTRDGSNTVFSDTFQESYHSIAGAVTESKHVFINAGLRVIRKRNISIFEMGFGTGLNALLTFLEAQQSGMAIRYTAIELYPPKQEILTDLANNFSQVTNSSVFHTFHDNIWNQDIHISTGFTLFKIQGDLLTTPIGNGYDLVYYDAFSPATQPDLWTEDVFHKMFDAMNMEGILTTYCAKGSVRRALLKAGFIVERLPGPPPKREMLRACKK